MNLQTGECDLVLTDRRAEPEGRWAVIEEPLERLRAKALEFLETPGLEGCWPFYHFKLEVEPVPDKGGVR